MKKFVRSLKWFPKVRRGGFYDPSVVNHPKFKDLREANPTASTVTILVAEDDSLVQSTIANALSMHGFRVLLANDGEEALTVLDSEPDVKVLLVDCVMPKLSGLELLEKLRYERPELPTVLMTADTALASRLSKSKDKRHHGKLVTKPCSIDRLIQILEGAISPSE